MLQLPTHNVVYWLFENARETKQCCHFHQKDENEKKNGHIIKCLLTE